MNENPPSWIDSGAEIKGGLDLLGLRVPVQYIGGRLLDGVTTITPQVRYLTIRSWLISLYGKTGQADNFKDFIDFASRLESSIVLGNLLQDRGITGLIGAEEAMSRLDLSDPDLLVSSLVKTPASVIYTGPSEQLGISRNRSDNVPALTNERGVLLATALQQTIGGKFDIFESIIKHGSRPVSRETLSEVGNLCRIDKVPEAEREILSEILLPKAPLSAQEFSRLGSYACLLLLAKQSGRKSTESDLFAGALALGGFGDELFTPVANGWTRYCARDAIAVTHECALSCMVNEITSIHARTGNGASPTTVIANLLGQVGDHNSALKDLGIIQGYETVSSLSYVEVRDRTLALFINEKPATPLEIRRWAHPLNEVTLYQRCLSAGAASVSLALIAWIMTAFRLDEESKLDTPESSWTSYQGNNRLGLSEIILPELNRFERDAFSFLEAAGELAMRTMSQHLQTAWSRLQVDVRRDVALISTEGNRWFPREGKTFYPGRTASRLSQAIGWMMQLNLIDNAGITPFGQAHLDRAKKTLSEGHCS